MKYRQIEGELFSTPDCDSANASGVANLLQDQKNKQIILANPTLDIPLHHFPVFLPLSAGVSAENNAASDSNSGALNV